MENRKFELVSNYKPTGDQPQAIDKLVKGLEENKKFQVLLGATGTGKTFTMANVIQRVQRPTLILVHNKTLAGQLYAEFKELFPHNRVEYFVSNFDFYQPEAYLPKTDTYIDKSVQMNEEIEMMRSSAINSVLERRDTIVVASVASIYGLTDPEEYKNLVFSLRVGEEFDKKKVSAKLIDAQYERNNMELKPGTFRMQGDMLEIAPASTEDYIVRVYIDFDEIDEIDIVKPLTGEIIHTLETYPVYPAYEHASGMARVKEACKTIREELMQRLGEFHEQGKLLEEERLDMRTRHDLESLEEFGYCPGIENYSRHIDGRAPGETPFTLFDYFPSDFLLMVDESHVTFSQIRGMFNGDRSRKQTLVDYGFRLPSALDNRPLKFDEFESHIKNVICTSATPGDYELEKTHGAVIEQIIRPTGLIDPQIEVRSNKNNPVYDLIGEIEQRVEKNERVMVVTLTVKDAMNLTDFLKTKNYKVAYLQHEIKTLERTEIIYKLRKGDYQVLVGINLLREGLDIPEVSLIAILDADKEGFLRSSRSLIQIVGRAARNAEGKVIMYADTITDSMDYCIKETNRRREIQMKYNEEHNITPKTIIKPIKPPLHIIDDKKEKRKIEGKLTRNETLKLISEIENSMKKASQELDFEKAAELRDEMLELKATLL